MLKAILFDLDNTLILFDEKEYFRHYISKITPAFADLMPPEIFPKKLLQATRRLVENNGGKSNADFFMDIFSAGFETKRDDLWQRFMDFYATEYDQFQRLVAVPEGVRDVFTQLIQLNLKIVIASNPMFPLSIQQKRIAWAGIGDLPLALITHIGNMSFCKPRIEYYQQICQKLDVPPEACLMVGDDPVNDMIVSGIGMKTYLTNDSMNHENSALAMSRELRQDISIELPTSDFQGKLSNVPAVVRQLMRNQPVSY